MGYKLQDDKQSSAIDELKAELAAWADTAFKPRLLRPRLGGGTVPSRGTTGPPDSEHGDSSVGTTRTSHLSRAGPDTPAASDLRRAYTVDETTRVLGISRSTVYKLIKLQSLKTLKLCGRRVVTRDSIEALLNSDQVSE